MIHSYDFKQQDHYRASFNRLSQLVFGIEFEAWFQKGCWDDDYICHSIVSDNEIIANISVSRMNLVVEGVTMNAIQIGTVMTHPEHRGKGYSKQLMEYVLKTYEKTCDVVFLFANSTVLDFYPKFGFKATDESQFFINVNTTSTKEVTLNRLNGSREEDWNLIKNIVQSRRPISQRFGVTNNQALFTFYALSVYPECLYYSPKDDAIIIYEHDGEVLHLYDVVSTEEIDLEYLIVHIAAKESRKIKFYFTPDQLLDQVYMAPFDKKEDVLFVKSNSDLSHIPPFCVPKLAHA
ncbi:putative GNAT family N-acyltransferase [Paenibacillus castaneae]|uniref:GNAT family N-acetyltransferase n=1 Tax=Paenibacillus castaneae TaxID=474957 RepID=UPI00141BA478|nr:GNAT family N-acetyltransferase [Paenibacillus castaneae]NIK76505.1 putative GNAT family N-acyltransferase [Paenibacillus castaneae]